MLKLITAYDKNFLIGKGNYLPWNIPEDFEHFKKITKGKTMVMGDVTFKGIGKPLPGRKTIILTLDKDFSFSHPDVIVMHSIEEVLDYAKDNETIICGGATIYKLFLPYVDEMIITQINNEYEGNVYFPIWDEDLFKVSKIEELSPLATVKYYLRK